MMTTSHYYTATESSTNGRWKAKVYHYDATGNVEIIDHTSGYLFPSRERAIDASVAWCEDNGVDAEME